MGPRLSDGKLNLPAAIERIGARLVAGWIGQTPGDPHLQRLSVEREAAVFADEGIAAANYFEPPEPEPTPAQASCVDCGRPSTQIMAGQPYCDQHGKPLPVPTCIARDLGDEIAQVKAQLAAAGEQQEQDPPEPDPADLFRWAEAHALVRDGVFVGGLRPDIRWPGGKVERPDGGDEWRVRGFPAADEVCLPGGAHLIFDAAELDAFDPRNPTATASPNPKGGAEPWREKGWYIGDLEAFIAELKTLRGRRAEGIAQQFRNQHPLRAHLPELRSITAQAEPLLDAVRKARTAPAIRPAGDGSQPR